MSEVEKFDIHFREPASLDYHFCRAWDGETGCYGTNPGHGYTFDEAKEQIAQHYERLAAHWRATTYDQWKNP